MKKWRYWDEEKTRYTVYSDDPTKKLRQVETGREYNDATDWVTGHREENGEQVPYGRYTYEEIDKTPEELAAEQEAKNYALQHEIEKG